PPSPQRHERRLCRRGEPTTRCTGTRAKTAAGDVPTMPRHTFHPCTTEPWCPKLRGVGNRGHACRGGHQRVPITILCFSAGTTSTVPNVSRPGWFAKDVAEHQIGS